MTHQPKLTRRAAILTAFGLSLAPALAAGTASARGGPDPWKPKRQKPKSHKRENPGGPRQR